MEKELQINSNYFQRYFANFLVDTHPELFHNGSTDVKKMIIEKSDKAEDIYINQIKEGQTHLQALYASQEFLKSDFGFCFFHYLFAFISNHFPLEFNKYSTDDEKYRILIISIIFHLKSEDKSLYDNFPDDFNPDRNFELKTIGYISDYFATVKY